MPGQHRNPQVQTRVPADERDAWRTLFSRAVKMGLSQSAARLSAKTDDWGDVYRRLQQAVLDIEEEWPGPDEAPDTPEALLDWIVGIAPQAGQLYREIQHTHADLVETQRALDATRQQLTAATQSGSQEHETQLEALKNAVYEEQRQWHLTQRARDIVMDLARDNWTTEDLNDWVRLIKAARVTPDTYAPLWEEYGGLERMIRTLEPEVQKLEALRQQVVQHMGQLQQQAQQAAQTTEQARDRQVKAQEGLAKAQAAIQQAQGEAQQWRQIAAAFGWWIPDIGHTWTAAVETPSGMERALAATLLLHALQRDGDTALTIPGSADPRHFRLPVQVPLHELIGILAPPALAQEIFAQVQAPRPASNGQAGPAHPTPPEPSDPAERQDATGG